MPSSALELDDPSGCSTVSRPLVGARRRSGGARPLGALRRLAAVLRGARRARAGGARLRGPALGRRRPARLRRPPRGLGFRRAAARRLHDSPRAAGAAAGLGRRKAERTDALDLAALGRRDRAAARRLARATGLPAEVQASLLARAGGNPLYAEQFARLLDEVGADEDSRCPRTCRGSSRRGSTALPLAEKQLLQDAAVLGKVFWLGAVCAVGGRAGAEPRPLCMRSRARNSFAASVGRRSPAMRSTPSGTCSCATSPTGRSRGRRAPSGTRRPPRWIEALGRPEDHARDAGPPLSRGASARPRGRRRAGRRPHRARAARRPRRRRSGVRARRLSGSGPLLRGGAGAWPAEDDRERPTCCSPTRAAASTTSRSTTKCCSRRARRFSARAGPRRRPRPRHGSAGIWMSRGDRDQAFAASRARARARGGRGRPRAEKAFVLRSSPAS